MKKNLVSIILSLVFIGLIVVFANLVNVTFNFSGQFAAVTSTTPFLCVFNATKYADYYPDLKKAFGYNEVKLKKHWLNYGIKEQRTPCGADWPSCSFNSNVYVHLYPDLINANVVGIDHYKMYGVKEGRGICKITYYEPSSKVTYYGSDGSKLTSNIYVIGRVVQVLPMNSGVSSTSIGFGVWNTVADGSGTDYIPGSNITIGVKDVNLYVKWMLPYLISNWSQLDDIRNHPSAYYILTADLSSTTLGYIGLGSHWTPIGAPENVFAGHFDGGGHTISDLIINSSSSTSPVGLFANSSGNISKVGLANVNISGINNIGGLVGVQDSGTVSTSYVTGNVSGRSYVGGLVGQQKNGTISNSHFTGNVSSVMLGGSVGGLVGWQELGTISNSYSAGKVYGTGSQVGGLVGVVKGKVNNSYSTTDLIAPSSPKVGGLVGYLYGGAISNSYSLGNVIGRYSVGGLIGAKNTGTTTNSYWDTQTSGTPISADGTGTTTLGMKISTTFNGWDIGVSTQDINNGYPYLGWQIGTSSHAWFVPGW